MIAALLALLATSVLAIPTISIKGSKFFTSDGAQFYIKGVAYQLTEADPLVDGNQCQLDASLMKKLGANTIRVYHVDASGDHDACMSAFSDAGIYVFLDLDTFDTYILQDSSVDPSWNQSQYDAYARVMDTFHKYDNVAGFFVGNEMLTTGAQSIAAPYVKAAARDMKAYRDSKGYRNIPIGYSAADIAVLRPNLQNYLACGGNSSETIDFYGLNAYEWCGDSTYPVSGYINLQKNASDYDIPIFFSETGCITVRPRTFADQASIFGSDMRDTWSGAIIYEWLYEANSYGLVGYSSSVTGTATAGNTDSFIASGTPTPVVPDFDNLSSQWATLTPTGVSVSAYSPSLSPPACPAFTSNEWMVNGGVALPTLGQTFDASVSSAIASGTGVATGSDSSSSSPSPSPSQSTAGGNGIWVSGLSAGMQLWTVGAMVGVMGLAILL